MKKRVELTDTVRDISKKTGIPESVFRNFDGRKIRFDCKVPSLIKKATKK